MIITAQNKIGGALVGVGIRHRDGSTDFKWLARPKHNRIVSGGIDHILEYNGLTSGGLTLPHYLDTPILVSPFFGHHDEHYGALFFCARGTGTSATTSTMTGLEAQVGAFTSSLKTENPFFGTSPNYTTREIKFRVTHVHDAETSAQTITELGWFGQYGSDATKRMFSRVVMESPVTLDTGEQLITTYELTIQREPALATSTTIGGLQAQIKHTGELTQSSAWSGDISDCFYIRAGSSDLAGTKVAYGALSLQPWAMITDKDTATWTNAAHPGAAFFPGIYSSDKSFPPDSSGEWTSPSYSISSSGDVSQEFVDYVEGTGYRDIRFIMGAQWPDGKVSISIPYMVVRGIAIRFGHYDTDGTTWVSTPLTKGANQRLTVTLRTAYTTD